MYDDNFETTNTIEEDEAVVLSDQDFEKSFAKGIPKFAGEQPGMTDENNQPSDETATELNNEGLNGAAVLINYGLDAIAREKGVEAVVQGIKTFDASKSDKPLRDLYVHLGINNIEDLKDAKEESDATRQVRDHFRDEYNMPSIRNRSREGMLKAIQDMKELIAEVEGVDPRYEELRNAAKTAGKGYFEYAVKDYGVRGLTELFSVLAKQKESNKDKNKEEKIEEKNNQKESFEEPDRETPGGNDIIAS